MRADRLISILMLLQARGRMTAQALAEELEVSARTIYRDADALERSGIPITTERGPGGGIALLDSYKTSLTGLSEHEIQALLLLSVPAAMSDLGIGHDLQRALRKLSAAASPTYTVNRQQEHQRILLDAAPWRTRLSASPGLQVIQRAMQENQCLSIRYKLAWGAEQTRVVLPLGLVAKENQWYLVCTWGEGPRVLTESSLVATRTCSGEPERPPGFDLASYWTAWCQRTINNRNVFTATLSLSADLYTALKNHYIHGEIEAISAPGTDGRVIVRLTDSSFEDARTRILGWGNAARVIRPVALRDSVRDFAEQVAAVYAT